MNSPQLSNKAYLYSRNLELSCGVKISKFARGTYPWTQHPPPPPPVKHNYGHVKVPQTKTIFEQTIFSTVKYDMEYAKGRYGIVAYASRQFKI